MPRDGRVDRALHLHRFHHQQPVALLDLLVQLHGDRGDDARDRRADLAGIAGIGLDARGAAFDFEAAVADGDFARLAVQFEEDRARAVGMRLADGEEFDDQRLAGLEFDGDLLARSMP